MFIEYLALADDQILIYDSQLFQLYPIHAILIFDLTFMFNQLFIRMWRSNRELLEDIFEITMPFLAQHRDILELLPNRKTKDRLLRALHPEGAEGR